MYRLSFPDSKHKSVLCDMTSCSPLKVNRRFEGTYRLHLQAVCYPFHGSFLGGLSFDLKVVGDILVRNVGWLSTDNFSLHDVIPQETELCEFIPLWHAWVNEAHVAIDSESKTEITDSKMYPEKERPHFWSAPEANIVRKHVNRKLSYINSRLTK
jgi:hypothetical protein